MKVVKVIGGILGLLAVVVILMPSAPTPVSVSKATFEQVDQATGCQSKNSSDKKEHLFDTQFKNHQLTWSGVVVTAGDGNVSIDTNGAGTQDLRVSLKDKQQAVELQKGQKITVQFTMNNIGGCVLPYSGSDAIVMN